MPGGEILHLGVGPLVFQRHQVAADSDVVRSEGDSDGGRLERRAAGVDDGGVVPKDTQVRHVAARVHLFRDDLHHPDGAVGRHEIHVRFLRGLERRAVADRRDRPVGHAIADQDDVFSAHRRLLQKPRILRTSPRTGGLVTGATDCAMALSGSFRPCPVSVQTSRCPLRKNPSVPNFITPATEAAEAGSQKIPSVSATILYASRISASLTIRMRPPDSSRAASACLQEAGLPIRMAVATVSGFATGAPRTIGAAPSACQPSIAGSRVDFPAARYCLYPAQYAVMFPAFPTGRMW